MKNQMPKTKITRKLQLGRKLLTLKLYNAITWLPTNLFSEAKRMALQSQFRVWWGYQTLDYFLSQIESASNSNIRRPWTIRKTCKFHKLKQMLVRGCVYKQMCAGERKQIVIIKETFEAYEQSGKHAHSIKWNSC